MKKATSLLCCIGLTLATYAQDVFSNKTNVAIKKVIEDYRTSNHKAFSWYRELFTTADFEQAKTQYNELYQQIHNTIIKLDGEKPVILNGLFEMPDKDKQRNSIFFNFLPATGLVQKLKVELVLLNNDGKYTITLMVYEPGKVDFKVMG